MKNILEHLEETVLKYPSKIALADENRQVSFLSLMNNSQKIAGALKHLSRNSPVAIMTDRSAKCVEAMFAAVYAGCFYTVIDIDSPINRITEIFKTLKPQAVITDLAHLELAGRVYKGNTITVYEQAIQAPADLRFIKGVRDRMVDADPLYVLFTSGSSGIPKGTVVSHRSVISYIDWVTGEFGFDDATVFGSQTPLYFSMSVTDLYSTMKCGCTYDIIPKALFSFPVKLIEHLNSRRVNTLYWVPSALAIAPNWDLFQYAMPEHLEKVLFAGEVMPTRHLNYWMSHLPECTYANLFGPTETTDICTFYVVDRSFDDSEILPIGKACDNCDVFLLTEDGRMANPGQEGELVVRGAFLADGYYNDPVKTAAAFCQNPLNTAYPDRIYRTGDLVRLNERGEYVYISRKDNQIKRMGYRIELGEVEAAANSMDSIRASAALYDSASKQLLLVCDARGAEAGSISEHLKDMLPDYMLPDRLISVDAMPYNANGKIDRSKLNEIYIKRNSEVQI